MEVLLRKKVPAVLENLGEIMMAVADSARMMGFSADRVLQVELALEEPVVNVMNYAYGDGSGDIEVACIGRDDGALGLEIIDSGRVFDPLKKEDPDISLGIDDREIGGLGVYFVKQVANEVTYNRVDGKNIFTMVFHKQPPGK